MCTTGGLGRQSTDYRSTIGQWTDISADSGPINVHVSADASADSRSIYRSSIGRLSVDNRWTDISADSRLINVYISGDALVDYRSIVSLYVDRGHL